MAGIDALSERVQPMTQVSQRIHIVDCCCDWRIFKKGTGESFNDRGFLTFWGALRMSKTFKIASDLTF